jgi:hypothetical protein
MKVIIVRYCIETLGSLFSVVTQISSYPTDAIEPFLEYIVRARNKVTVSPRSQARAITTVTTDNSNRRALLTFWIGTL